MQQDERVYDNEPVEVLQLRLAPQLIKRHPEDVACLPFTVDLARQLPVIFSESTLPSGALWNSIGIAEVPSVDP